MADGKVVIFVLTQFFTGHVDEFLEALLSAADFRDGIVDSVFVAGDDRFDVQGTPQNPGNLADAAAFYQILQSADPEQDGGALHGCLCF